MRSLLPILALTSLLLAADSPYLKLNRATTGGQIEVAVENISGKPVVAYVVAVQHSNGQSSTVSYGVYTDGDHLAPGALIGVAKVDSRSVSGELTAYVDYVRLADGTSWGDTVTEQGKLVAARFRK